MVKITVKTVKKDQYEIDVDPSDTVQALKERLASSYGVGDPSSQRLIHQGKIIGNDSFTVSELSLKEGDFLVLMVKAPAAAPAAPAPVPAPAPAPAPAPSPSPAPAPAPPVEQQRFSPADEEKLSMLEAMGFPREMAVAALRAAFGDADRAVQYLMDGIPDDLMTDRDPPAPAAPAAQPAAARAPPAAAQPAGGAAPFSADSVAMALGTLGGAPRAAMTPLQRMQSDPQLMQLIAMARQNPALVQPLLTQLAASNPPMLQLIQQHQADFTSLLNGTAPPLAAPPPAAQGGPFTGADILAAMGMGGAPAGGAPAPNTVPPAGPPGMVRIALTPAEAEAVTRLESMGFPRDVALQAFMACDKDENAAANLLFDGGM
jgi:hypothetical protein